MSTEKIDVLAPEFIQKLKDDPEAAIREVGVEPTAEMLDALKKLDVEALIKFVGAFPEPPPTIHTTP